LCLGLFFQTAFFATVVISAFSVCLALIFCLELFISFLQAYTFVFLCMLYFSEATTATPALLCAAKENTRPCFFWVEESACTTAVPEPVTKSFGFITFLLLSAPKSGDFYFQESGTDFFSELITFHNDVMFLL